MHEIYLNHAGTSWPKPPEVIEAIQDAMSRAPSEWPKRFEQAHQAIAEAFGVNRLEQLLLTPGCTSALAVGIADLPIESGSRVLTSHWEHHALHRPLLKLASKGVRIETIPPVQNETDRAPNSPLDVEWLELELSKGDVGLVAITAACNVTGELLPYEEVIRISRQHGVTVLLDAAQIVGWQRLDFSTLGADLVAFGGHKGLQAPWGIGGLYIGDEVQMECISATCSLPAAGDIVDKPPVRPGYCDVGSVDQLALAGLHAAVRHLCQQDTHGALAKARAHIERIREALHKLDHVRILGPTDSGHSVPTLALIVAGRSSGEVAARLLQDGLVVGSGFQCAPLAHEALGTQVTGVVRLSVGVGQAGELIDEAIIRLLGGLQEMRDTNK